jgi:hypothetical protein
MKKLHHQLTQKFSITAPRLSVRPHLPWYVRWLLVVPFVLAAAWLVWWAYGSGMELAGFHRAQAEDELSRLNREVTELQATNANLSNQLVDTQRQMQMEHAANAEMQQQLKTLGDEKAHLDEDLAFYQDLTLSGSRKENLSIHHVTVVKDSLPGEYLCSMLLVQTGQRPKDFHGNLQLVVNIRRNKEESVMLFPKPDSPDAKDYKLDFKFYRRVERSIQIPPDAVLESVQVRVFERGTSEPKVRQDATLS